MEWAGRPGSRSVFAQQPPVPQHQKELFRQIRILLSSEASLLLLLLLQIVIMIIIVRIIIIGSKSIDTVQLSQVLGEGFKGRNDLPKLVVRPGRQANLPTPLITPRTHTPHHRGCGLCPEQASVLLIFPLFCLNSSECQQSRE